MKNYFIIILFLGLMLSINSLTRAESLADKMKNTLLKHAEEQMNSVNNAQPTPTNDIAVTQQNNRVDSTDKKTSNVDIVGIRLGMKVSEAHQSLEKYLPNVKGDEWTSKFNDIPSSDYISAIIAQRNTNMNSTEKVEALFAAPPNEPLVIEVARQITLDNTEQTTLDNMVAAVNKKYGEPVKTIDLGSGKYGRLKKLWVWNSKGEAQSHLDEECTKYLLGLDNLIFHNNPGGDAYQVAVSRYPLRTKCVSKGSHVVITADLNYQADTRIFNGGTFIAVNLELSEKSSAATEQYISEFKERERQEKIEKAASQKGPAL